MSNNYFTCEMCGNTYEKVRSDEEAREEAKKQWSKEEWVEGESIVCDECFNKFFKHLTVQCRND